MKFLRMMVVMGLVLVGCGGADDGLSADERAWCTFTGASEEDALKFDIIFERGLELNLGMDFINANAAELRAQYEADGMSPGDAVAAVSKDLLKFEDFVTACKSAFATDGAG